MNDTTPEVRSTIGAQKSIFYENCKIPQNENCGLLTLTFDRMLQAVLEVGLNLIS